MRGQQPYFREHLLYINGEWVPQTDGEVMEDRNPADGSVMAMVHMGGRQDAEKALAAGAKVITLGRRILRTETAPLAVLAMLGYCLEP